MKRIVSIFLSVIILCASAVTVYAHPNKHGGAILDTYMIGKKTFTGDESIGWAVKENCHLNSHTATYRFDSGVATSYRTEFNQGAALWSNNTNAQLTLTTSSSANITVRMKNSSDTDVSPDDVAFAQPSVLPDSNGHTSKWEIVICIPSSISELVFAHEIGHVFGLADLYSFGNLNEIMYCDGASIAQTLGHGDILGYKFITGQHTNHSWVYESNSKRYCSVCDGISTYNHPYTWTNHSAYKHRGYCSHCQQSVYVNHSFSYVNITSTTHTKKCSVCNVSSTQSHNFVYTNLNATQHKKVCSQCNKSITENHTKNTFVSQNAAQHKVYCKCGKYRGLENHTPNSTNTGCTLCNYVGSVGGTVSYPGDDE